jgi:hypothetical protein
MTYRVDIERRMTYVAYVDAESRPEAESRARHYLTEMTPVTDDITIADAWASDLSMPQFRCELHLPTIPIREERRSDT